MTKEEIDVMWHQAMTTADIDYSIRARDTFANLVLEKAAEIADKSYATDDVLEAIRSMKT